MSAALDMTCAHCTDGVIHGDDCDHCIGKGTRTDVHIPPDRRLHHYAQERIATSLVRLLTWRRVLGAESLAASLAAAFSLRPTRLGAARVVRNRVAPEHREAVLDVVIGAIEEHAAVRRGDAWRIDGVKREAYLAEAFELEAYARRLRGEG